MDEELKAKFDAIAREMGDDRFFTKKELEHLPEILETGEEVLAFASGLLDGNTWLIALTDRRVLFLDKGMLYGLKQISIDLDRVNSVQGSTGLLLGKIIITDGAQSYKIESVPKKTVGPFTNKVRDTISRRKAAGASPMDQPSDRIGQIERLVALKDAGVLTEEEFAAEKERILGS